MMLEFRPDAEIGFAQQEAWWKGELDQVNLSIRAPKQAVRPREVPAPPKVEERWTNIDYVLDRQLAQLESTTFFGSGLPSMRANLGPSFMTATLGCPLNFLPETTWTEPAIADWKDFEGFPDYQQNPWYQLLLDMTERLSAAARGRCVLMLPDLHPGGDGVASLRGNENFLMDLYDFPDRVRMALEHLDNMFIEMLDTFYSISRKHGHAGCAGFTGWGPNKTFPVQDDTLALVSPGAAREFLLPGILRQARSLDNATFHLDGPEALDKLDMLLEAPELRDIQWVPGAAHQEMTQWIPLMKRILGAGKWLTTGCKPAELEPILREVPARGLRLYIAADDEDQARELLRLGERLSH